MKFKQHLLVASVSSIIGMITALCVYNDELSTNAGLFVLGLFFPSIILFIIWGILLNQVQPLKKGINTFPKYALATLILCYLITCMVTVSMSSDSKAVSAVIKDDLLMVFSEFKLFIILLLISVGFGFGHRHFREKEASS